MRRMAINCIEKIMEKKTLSDIFGDTFFGIPDYQRGYSWGHEQLDDIWKDISWIRNEKGHYTGGLTLREVNPEFGYINSDAPYKVFEVVDGQQRLTTLFILISRIINRIKLMNVKKIAGRSFIQVRDKFFEREVDDEQILCLIYQDEELNEKFRAIINGKATKYSLNFYDRNIIFAIDFFDAKIKKLELSDLEELFRKTTYMMYFNIVGVNNDFDVCAMFEVMNYRGKALTKFEVLKNRLIYLCELIKDCDKSFSTKARLTRVSINSAWGYVYKKLGMGDKPLAEDDFLRVHANIYFGYKKDIDFLFKEVFSIDKVADEYENKLTLDFIDKYVESINYSIDLWVYQRCLDYSLEGYAWWASKGVSNIIGRINCLNVRHFDSMILGALVRINNKKDSKNPSAFIDVFIKFLSQVEKFIFINYKLVGARLNHKSKRLLEDHGYLFVNNKKSFPAAQKDIDILIAEEFCGDEDDFKKFHTKMADKAKARFHNGKGWMDWSSIIYFLTAYYIDQGLISRRKRFNHVYESVERYRIYDEDILNSDKYKFTVNDIGNIALKSDEILISDVDFSDNYTNFIDDRNIKMLKFMFLHWDIPRINDEDISNLSLDNFTAKSIPLTTKRKLSSKDYFDDFDLED